MRDTPTGYAVLVDEAAEALNRYGVVDLVHAVRAAELGVNVKQFLKDAELAASLVNDTEATS